MSGVRAIQRGHCLHSTKACALSQSNSLRQKNNCFRKPLLCCAWQQAQKEMQISRQHSFQQGHWWCRSANQSVSKIICQWGESWHDTGGASRELKRTNWLPYARLQVGSPCCVPILIGILLTSCETTFARHLFLPSPRPANWHACLADTHAWELAIIQVLYAHHSQRIHAFKNFSKWVKLCVGHCCCFDADAHPCWLAQMLFLFPPEEKAHRVTSFLHYLLKFTWCIRKLLT